MANKDIFSTRNAPATDTVNAAGGKAYSKDAKAALAGVACTGTFNGAFYARPQDQFKTFMDLAKQCDEEFLAKVAIYGRHSGYMKDIPAALVAYLFAQGSKHFPYVFEKVIDNGRMLRNFVQMVRSGAFGRKSFGTRGKKAIQKWLNDAHTLKIMRANVGNEPSLRDILRMVHVKPTSSERGELFNWVVNGSFDYEMAPSELKRLKDWMGGGEHGGAFGSPPPIDWRACEFPGMTEENWRTLGRSMGWMALRMNLKTLERHGAFNEVSYTHEVATRLRNAEEIAKFKQFPYQIFQAWKETDSLPHEIQEALQDALELALNNVPEIDGEIVVIPDVSGSMSHPVTGARWDSRTRAGQKPSKTRCVDVAGLVAAAFVRKNPGRVRVLPVDTRLHETRINPRDSVVSVAQTLSGFGGGGTNLSLAMDHLVKQRHKADLVVIVSDNESWAGFHRGYGTGLQQAWQTYRSMFKGAKLVNVDLWGSETSQTQTREDVLMVSGFSDMVFKVIGAFSEGGAGQGDYWVKKIQDEVALAL